MMWTDLQITPENSEGSDNDGSDNDFLSKLSEEGSESETENRAKEFGGGEEEEEYNIGLSGYYQAGGYCRCLSLEVMEIVFGIDKYDCHNVLIYY